MSNVYVCYKLMSCNNFNFYCFVTTNLWLVTFVFHSYLILQKCGYDGVSWMSELPE
jgi:hypothetical protein